MEKEENEKKDEKEEEEEEDEKEEKESEISFKSENRGKENETFTQKLAKTFLPNNTNLHTTFPFKYFSCCVPEKEEEQEITDLDVYDGDDYMENEEIKGVMSLFPSKYIRKDEKKYLKFDKPNIISFFKDYGMGDKEKFVRKFEKFDKFGLRMFMMEEKNKFSSTIPITRCQIEIPNSLFTKGVPSVEQVGNAIINPESRMQWDKNFQEYKILKKLNDHTETILIVTSVQMHMIKPREFYEKRTHFVEDGIFYSYSSSAPDSIRPPKKEPIRALDFFGFFSVSQQNNQIFIDSFHQIDIKIGQPGPLIFMSLPLKMTEFTNNLINFLNQ